ncbi:MAG TPA: MgtC/SapB family protein [Longimicrobiales bacterium]
MDPPLEPITIVDWLRRFVVAAAAGAILGLPAQVKRRPGGIRTHALVSLGAAVFCMTAIAVVGTASEQLLRVIQGIASGIGFIGGAAVLRGDHIITGINTAASIWISAAVGSAISFMRSPVLGILAAVVATILNWAFSELDLKLERRANEATGEAAGPDRTG